MYLDNNDFVSWMEKLSAKLNEIGKDLKSFIQTKDVLEEDEKIMERFDQLDKFMELMSGRCNVLNGGRLLDNQDLCRLLNVSKRTLQRYRSARELNYITIHHKIYYTEKNVAKFMTEHFTDSEEKDEIET